MHPLCEFSWRKNKGKARWMDLGFASISSWHESAVYRAALPHRYTLLYNTQKSRYLKFRRASAPYWRDQALHTLVLMYSCPYACNGPPSGLETVLSETCWLSFSTTFFEFSMEWTRNRMPTFAYTSFSQKNKKKSRSGRKIGAVGDDKQLIFLTRPNVQFFNFSVRLLFKCGFYLRAAYIQIFESTNP